ncbi:MAG TPA: hypothetical protein VGO62_13750 [Myxococcota bacterium]
MTSRERLRLLRVLEEQPLAVNVTDIDGRLVFSDIPERLVDQLQRELGDAFTRAMVIDDAERAFIASLPEVDAAPARWRALYDSGALAARVSALASTGETATYFMAAVNTSDESVLGRTGVLYFTCTKGCHFCQYRGFTDRSLSVDECAELMLALQEGGAHNVQWLSPTAYTGFLLRALLRAAEQGFALPIVHKSEGEDALAQLALLDDVVDIYVPDAKFVRAETASKIGLSQGYAERLPLALREMQRQVGPLSRRRGTLLAQSGVLARHLLMPDGVDEAALVFALLAEIDPHMAVHLMTLYQPFDRAREMPGLDRPTTVNEGERAIAALTATGLRAMIR